LITIIHLKKWTAYNRHRQRRCDVTKSATMLRADRQRQTCAPHSRTDRQTGETDRQADATCTKKRHPPPVYRENSPQYGAAARANTLQKSIAFD